MDKIINLELERVSRLPMLDTNLKDLQDLVSSFVNQLVSLGHRDLISSFPVGRYTAEISVKITEAEG